MEIPRIYFCGLSYEGQILPHIWTATTKTFTITFHVPSEVTTSLSCRLFGIQRCKFNEDKYNRCCPNQPEEEEMVPVQNETLSIISISSPKATVSPLKMNDFLCTIPSSGKSTQIFSVTFECLRNHWERLNKEKFMMFTMQLIVNEKFIANLRLYAQKTAPPNLETSKEDAMVTMIPIQPKQIIPPQTISPPVPKKQKLQSKPCERIQKELELLCYSSPEASSSDSDFYGPEKRTFKRRFAEEEFVLDTSPLPAELILVWSNVLNYCSDFDSSPESSPGPVVNTFPVTIDLTMTNSHPGKRTKYYFE